MFALRNLSRRRLLAFVGFLALLFGLAMLHPYPRQSLFGPTIRGEPWCVWEQRVRRHAHWDKYEKSYWARTLGMLGVKQERTDFRELFDNVEMLPLLLEMMEDSDPVIRQRVLMQFYWHQNLNSKSALPALRARLNDVDEQCRIESASAIWAIERDGSVRIVLLQILNDPNSKCRFDAMVALMCVASQNDDALDALARFANDPDQNVRLDVMHVVYRLGERGLPILMLGVSDANGPVRKAAIEGLDRVCPDAKCSLSALTRCLSDPDQSVSATAREILRRANPELFEQLRKEFK